MTYADKLKDPRWQRKRLEMLERANFACQECGATKRTLHVHHRYYVSGRLPWLYPDFCYQVLCEDCHSELKYRTECRTSIDLVEYEPWEYWVTQLLEEKTRAFPAPMPHEAIH